MCITVCSVSKGTHERRFPWCYAERNVKVPFERRQGYMRNPDVSLTLLMCCLFSSEVKMSHFSHLSLLVTLILCSKARNSVSIQIQNSHDWDAIQGNVKPHLKALYQESFKNLCRTLLQGIFLLREFQLGRFQDPKNRCDIKDAQEALFFRRNVCNMSNFILFFHLV